MVAGSPTVLDNLFAQRQISHKMFSFVLAPAAADNPNWSTLVFCPPDPSYYNVTLGTGLCTLGVFVAAHPDPVPCILQG